VKDWAENDLPATVPGEADCRCAHPFGEDLRRHPAGVVMAAEAPGHAGGLDPRRGLRGRVVQHEVQGDLPVDRGEQPDRGRMVGLEDHPQLGLDRLLCLQ
jgi:hypothetical protein